MFYILYVPHPAYTPYYFSPPLPSPINLPIMQPTPELQLYCIECFCTELLVYCSRAGSWHTIRLPAPSCGGSWRSGSCVNTRCDLNERVGIGFAWWTIVSCLLEVFAIHTSCLKLSLSYPSCSKLSVSQWLVSMIHSEWTIYIYALELDGGPVCAVWNSAVRLCSITGRK